MRLRALYYPSARSFDRTFIKQCLLLFDEVLFTDPMERGVRQAIWYHDDQTGLTGHPAWDSMSDDYAFLPEKGCLRILDPCPTVRDYDGLMAQAMLCDLKDAAFMKLVAEMNQDASMNWEAWGGWGAWGGMGWY